MALVKRAGMLVPTILLFLLIFFTFAQAQAIFTAPDPGTHIQIIMSPQYPSAGETAHLVVRGGSLINISDSTIIWSLNGTVISKGVGRSSIDMKIGPLGQAHNITVIIQSPDGSSTSESLSFVPTHIDLLIDSDSYTPPFYRGRALPSPGTQLHLQALTYFKRTNGTHIPSSSIIYTWRRNNQVLGTVSGKGRSTVTIPAPVPYSTDTLSVDATTADGSLRGSATIRLSSVDPVLALYQDHPLFGVMYHQLMGGDTMIPDSEATFVAVPYFSGISSPTDPQLRYTWTVNSVAAPTNATRPDKIVINADKSDGKAVIELSLTHATNFFMNLKQTWDAVFRTTTSFDNPFSAGL